MLKKITSLAFSAKTNKKQTNKQTNKQTKYATRLKDTGNG
jgi:hypothetical protein